MICFDLALLRDKILVFDVCAVWQKGSMEKIRQSQQEGGNADVEQQDTVLKFSSFPSMSKYKQNSSRSMGLAGRKTSQRQQKEQRRNADVEEQAISKQKQAEDYVWSTTHPTTASVDNMWE